MNRRQFLSATTLPVCIGGLGQFGVFADSRKEFVPPSQRRPFTLRYAPHFGLFLQSAGEDPVDQLEFAANQGFTAWEDNEMKDRPIREQERIGKRMHELGIEMGVISALRGVWPKVSFSGSERNAREEVLAAMTRIVDVARRVDTKYLTVVPGLMDPKLPEGYQFANCIELLNRCCDIVEPHGLVMVLEPLNRQCDHPGVYLSGSPQAYAICKAVARRSCKILFDIYHQQITEGNLISNIDHCWTEIAYVQCGDNPGRNEPGTGEINYRQVFQHIADKGYRGIVGMEHGTSQGGSEGERRVIAAYRDLDPICVPRRSH